MAANYEKETHAIIKNVYPIVAKGMEKNEKAFFAVINDFMNRNAKIIHDVAPCDNVYYKQQDIDKLFRALNITEKQIEDAMEDCFYWKIPYKPEAAKEPYVLLCITALRYLLKKKKQKEAEITSIYLGFSGKFYASWFGMFFSTATPSKNRAVMDYVVNNVLTNKSDLKVEGTVFGAMKKLCVTWMNTYGPGLCNEDTDDATIGMYIRQLRERIRSFLGNIAQAFFDAYHDRNYLNYETDNLSDGAEFRITDSDSLRATRYTEVTVQYLMNNAVSLQICNKCKDSNIKPTEIKEIMESILDNRENIPKIYRVVNILICDFMRNYPGKSVGSVDFMANSLRMKPNTKDQYIIELKDIVISWLMENSPGYRKRRNRKATAISYYKAVILYFTFAISYAVS